MREPAPDDGSAFDVAELLPDEMRSELASLDSELRASRRQTLAQLLEVWRRYAAWVSSDRPVHFDDYHAMLAARDAIQQLIERASMTAGWILEALVRHQDSLFIAGTEPDEMNVLNADRWSERGVERLPPWWWWWWRRIPMRLDRTVFLPGFAGRPGRVKMGDDVVVVR